MDEPVLDFDRCNPAAAAVLSRFRDGQRVHAYLLTGAKGLGKRTLAMTLACTLYCTAERKPCFRCAECRKVLEGSHPDVITLFADDDKPIRIDPVREMIAAVSRHSFEGGTRTVMIEPVEKMTPQAQNCLLKSLEEPATDVVYLLMTHELSATLGTIASRCTRIKLVPRQDDVLSDTLVKCGFDKSRLNEVLPLCGGNIGQAVKLLSGNGEAAPGELFARDALSALTEAAVSGLTVKIKENRDQAESILAALESAVHRALLVRCGCMAAEGVKDLPALWQKAAREGSPEDLNAVLSAIFETRRRLASQVNWQASADHLLMILLEENRKWQK